MSLDPQSSDNSSDLFVEMIEDILGPLLRKMYIHIILIAATIFLLIQFIMTLIIFAKVIKI